LIVFCLSVLMKYIFTILSRKNNFNAIKSSNASGDF
jgi:hypothetical protein